MSKLTIKRARQNRSRIARVFAELEMGHIHATDVLRTPPSCLNRVLVFDVIRRFPRLGKDGAETVLKHAKVWPLTHFGTLTPEERSRIILHLPPRVKER